ncbi:unnamed protein product [Brassica rapa]|uniref:Uncharacterized protein n=1 Tax=Brassica campestris TaxID=3711 RepID=A0A8D9G746_BRACM|nr:unnamed protein product [Brassica rapa]
MLSPRTNVLICVLMESHRRPVCADGHTRTHTDVLCVLTDTHRRPLCVDGHPRTSCVHGCPVCADGHTRTSLPWMFCVCWQTPTDVLCVLNRQPTWAKITQAVHGKGQRAESKDQHADMCMMDSHERPVCASGHTRTAIDVLCVLTDIHERPVCADGHPRTSCVVLTDSHSRPVCAGGHPRTSCVYGTDSPRGPKSPKQSTGRASVLSPRTNVLIYVLMESHKRHVCADGHTRTHTDRQRRPVCADGHTRTSCVHPTWAKATRTVHGKGQRAESKDQRADMSTDVLFVLTDTHIHTQTASDNLCVLTDTHGRPPQTSCVC